MCEVPADEQVPFIEEPVSDVAIRAAPTPYPFQVEDRVVVFYEGREIGAAVTFRAASFTSVMLKLDERLGPYADRMPVLFDPETGDYVDLLEEKQVRLRLEKVDRK